MHYFLVPLEYDKFTVFAENQKCDYDLLLLICHSYKLLLCLLQFGRNLKQKVSHYLFVDFINVIINYALKLTLRKPVDGIARQALNWNPEGKGKADVRETHGTAIWKSTSKK